MSNKKYPSGLEKHLPIMLEPKSIEEVHFQDLEILESISSEFKTYYLAIEAGEIDNDMVSTNFAILYDLFEEVVGSYKDILDNTTNFDKNSLEDLDPRGTSLENIYCSRHIFREKSAETITYLEHLLQKSNPSSRFYQTLNPKDIPQCEKMRDFLKDTYKNLF